MRSNGTHHNHHLIRQVKEESKKNLGIPPSGRPRYAIAFAYEWMM